MPNLQNVAGRQPMTRITSHADNGGPVGDWTRSDRALALARSGDIETARRLFTMSGYARAMLRAERGDRDELELIRTIAANGLADNPAIVPVPIVGSITRFIDTSRPTVAAVSQFPMPSAGATFTRPRVSTGSTVGVQTENALLPSGTTTITDDLVSKVTVGGVVNISEQAIDDSGDPYVDAVARDMAAQYAAESDAVLTAAIEVAVSDTDVLAADATSDVVVSTLADALPDFVAAAGVAPDTLFVATDRFAQLAALVDDAKRPVVPALIADAINVRIIHDPQFTDGSMILAASAFVEFYEVSSTPVQIAVPNTLEVQVAVRGRVAAYVREEVLHGFTTS